jgi:ribokinase
MLEHLVRSGIDVSQVQVIDGVESATAFVILETSSGESRSVAYQGATKHWKIKDRSSVGSMAAGVRPDLIISTLSVAVEEVTQVLEAASREGVVTMLNPSPAQHLDPTIFHFVTHLVLNQAEVALLCQRHDPYTSLPIDWHLAARRFLDLGVEHVVITLAEKGAYYATRDGRQGTVGKWKSENLLGCLKSFC